MGIEGQMYMGGFAAVVVGLTFPELPKVVLLPTMLVASMLAGMIWALPPMLAKVYYGRSEVVPCMMLNYIAIYLTDFFVHNFFLASGKGKTRLNIRRWEEKRHEYSIAFELNDALFSPYPACGNRRVIL